MKLLLLMNNASKSRLKISVGNRPVKALYRMSRNVKVGI